VTEPDDNDRLRARTLAAEAAQIGNGTGWFERLYDEAARGEAVVPWADGEPNPHLVEWAGKSGVAGAGRRALVVGCGLGDDAEYVAGLGFDTVAFDISATAIRQAKERFADSPVEYVVGDITAPESNWHDAFDLVVEIYTVQPLWGDARAAAIRQLPTLVAPGGTLLVIARATEEPDPARDPAEMPWALTRAELHALAGDLLEPFDVRLFWDDEEPPRQRWHAEFRRPA
jgi:SAM-dependent methyltransferase